MRNGLQLTTVDKYRGLLVIKLGTFAVAAAEEQARL